MIDLVGGFACLLVLLTFSMRDMVMLRIVAILSNVAFIIYALMAGLAPVMALHAILLPVNMYALWSLQTGKIDTGIVARCKRAAQDISRSRPSPKPGGVRGAD